MLLISDLFGHFTYEYAVIVEAGSVTVKTAGRVVRVTFELIEVFEVLLVLIPT